MSCLSTQHGSFQCAGRFKYFFLSFSFASRPLVSRSQRTTNGNTNDTYAVVRGDRNKQSACFVLTFALPQIPRFAREAQPGANSTRFNSHCRFQPGAKVSTRGEKFQPWSRAGLSSTRVEINLGVGAGLKIFMGELSTIVNETG